MKNEENPCLGCDDEYECPGSCYLNHKCEENAELVTVSDGFLQWICQICDEPVSGFVGQFGVLWYHSNWKTTSK